MTNNFQMKHIYTCVMFLFALNAFAQNQLSSPSGQSLKVVTDTLILNGHMRVNNGYIKLNNFRFLSTVGELNSFVGANSGNLSTTGKSNTFFGGNSGTAITTAMYSTFMGSFSGYSTTSGTSNTFIGYQSGYTNVVGAYNTFVGNLSGKNSTGSSNTFIGLEAGYTNVGGGANLFAGRAAGYSNSAGNNNTLLGYGAGYKVTGSGNVMVGYMAGFNETGSNKLYIANSNTATPLIYGDFSTSRLVFNGKVSINSSTFPTTVGGTTYNNIQLYVNGGILAKNTYLSTSWADYVFEKKYRLRPLNEVNEFIKANGHLPGMPSGEEVEKYGLNVADVARRQQEKIEELTLYVIEHEKMIKRNQELIEEQKSGLEQIRALIDKLEK
jgi:hypothetical protein